MLVRAGLYRGELSGLTWQVKEVALLKMEGLSNEEIAAELSCTTRTVERKLAQIRRKWEREDQP